MDGGQGKVQTTNQDFENRSFNKQPDSIIKIGSLLTKFHSSGLLL